MSPTTEARLTTCKATNWKWRVKRPDNCHVTTMFSLQEHACYAFPWIRMLTVPASTAPSLPPTFPNFPLFLWPKLWGEESDLKASSLSSSHGEGRTAHGVVGMTGGRMMFRVSARTPSQCCASGRTIGCGSEKARQRREGSGQIGAETSRVSAISHASAGQALTDTGSSSGSTTRRSAP